MHLIVEDHVLGIKMIRKYKKKQGFTLLEMMVVVVIIGIIASFVAPKVSGYIRDAKVSAAKAEIQTLSSALTSYYSSHQEYAANLRILVTGGYLKKVKLNENKKVLDPWGIPYRYETQDTTGKKRQNFQLICAMADNIFGTEDDYSEDGGRKQKTSKDSFDDFDESLDFDSE